MHTTHPNHEQFFSEPRILDIAYDNRDFDVECGFLEHLSRNLGRGCLDSYVEICAGPGYHVHRFASRGVRAYATVCHSTMLGYAEEKAHRFGRLPHDEGDSKAGHGTTHDSPPDPSHDPHHDGPHEGRPGGADRAGPTRILLTDPRDFTLPEAVDLAFCPRGAFHYELSTDDVLSHLVTVAKNLGRGGLYVLELEHPAVLFGQRPAVWTWENRRGDTHVRATRRLDMARLDPLTQVCDLEIKLEVNENGEDRVVHDVAPVRSFTHQEIKTLVKQTGVFDWVATFGDLSVAQPFDTSDGSRAQVPVLRCSV